MVPGGGALADEVRSSQSSLGFGDEAAHRMALLAMDQLAWAVAGLRSGFEVGDTEQALRDALERNQVAVWAPLRSCLWSQRHPAILDRDLRQSSHSGLPDNSARAPATSSSPIARKFAAVGADQLARDGVVDAAFPSMLQQTGVNAYLLGRGDQTSFAKMLAGAGACGASID